jgi:molecular chaperone DnaK
MTNFLGIDLGTTNSVAVLSDGDRFQPVRQDDGSHLLPSVVRIDGRGHVTVGARARRFLDRDPDGTRGEFKRLMGGERRLAFRAAGVEKTPEELSALVLGELRRAAERATGEAPTRAVITVPALFELSQTRATSVAAGLAGFETVEHLQEPVASALTAGFASTDAAPWLVYDLGGGTFDVSLLETRDGVLRVVDHDGDNFLGGRDMDARILDVVLGELSVQLGRELRRSDPELAALIRRLRAACEDAKLELGRGVDALVSLAEPVRIGADELEVEVGVTASQFERLVTPLLDKTFEICERLCSRNGLIPAKLARVVLVGGPTQMDVLRSRLVDRLGVPAADGVDPMTAVAEGAARFAIERNLTTRPTATAGSSGPRGGAVHVFLQYPSVGDAEHDWFVASELRARFREIERNLGEAVSAQLFGRYMRVYSALGVRISSAYGALPPLAQAIFKSLAQDAKRYGDEENEQVMVRNVRVTDKFE